MMIDKSKQTEKVEAAPAASARTNDSTVVGKRSRAIHSRQISVKAIPVLHSQSVGMEAHPINNMGGTTDELADAGEQSVELVMDNGQVKIVPIRAKAAGQIAIIDQVTFSFCRSTISKIQNEVILSEDREVDAISELLERIFGFGITDERQSGSNFYHRSFNCGKFAQIGIGGQNNTCLVFLYGLGALKAQQGWESRLFDFLSSVANRPKITRVDLAYDDLEGTEISVDWALDHWHQGGFSWSNRRPNCEQLGNWLQNDGSGRTLTVGSRAAGKFTRIYEKGRKEGCKSSPWTRFEVELKNKDRVIPFDVLLDPSSYFAGSFPICQKFAEEANRVKTEKKIAEFNFNKMIRTIKHQFGKHLRFLSNYYECKEKVIDICQSDDENAVPRSIFNITSSINSLPEFFHHRKNNPLRPEDVDFSF